MEQESGIKNDLVQWFLKDIIIPNLMRIDTPGFVTVKKNYRDRDIEQRNLFYSETFMANFESAVVNELGKAGEKAAYLIGMNYAYAYCHSFGIPRLGFESEKSIDDFIKFYRAFMGVTWGEFINYKYDLKAKTFEAEVSNHIVCRKNGLGHIFTFGNLAGGFQYIFQDNTVQGIQPKCIGRGDKYCRII